jgi:hypothetical protein
VYPRRATLNVYADSVVAACKRSDQQMSLIATLGLSIGPNADPNPAGTNVHVFSRAPSSLEMCDAAGHGSW